MKKLYTPKKIIFKAIHPIITLIWLLSLFPLFYLVFKLTESVSYISTKTYFMIGIIFIILVIGYRILRKQIKKVEFLFTETNLQIREEKIIKKDIQQLNIAIPYSKIKNYNVYYMLIKKMGYIIRIKADKNYIYYVDWISLNGNDKFDTVTYIEVSNTLKTKTGNKKTIFIDILLLFYASIPWIMLLIGITCLIYIFYYIIYLI